MNQSWTYFRAFAEMHARQAEMRSERTCACLFCEQYSTEEEIFMCMFYLWAEEYGPGWWLDIGEEEDQVLDELVQSAGGAA